MALRFFAGLFDRLFRCGFFWRSYLVWNRTGINPYKLGKTDSAHDLGHARYAVGLLSGIAECLDLRHAGLGRTLIQIQVRLEEEHLRRMHGDDYQNYCQQTRR